MLVLLRLVLLNHLSQTMLQVAHSVPSSSYWTSSQNPARRRPEASPTRRSRERDLRHLLSRPGTVLLHLHVEGVVPSALNLGLKESKSQRLEHPLSGPGQGQAAQQDSSVSQNEEAIFDLVLRSNGDELLQQQQRVNGNQDATATFKDGLTALSAYIMLVLHYFENHPATANLHKWPIISHASLRHLSSRKAFTAAVARPGEKTWLGSCGSYHIFLISRFTRPPSVAIGEREIGLLAKALLASKVPYQHMFLLGAKEYAISEDGVHIWEFPVHHFPGPPWSPNQWYLSPSRPCRNLDCWTRFSFRC